MKVRIKTLVIILALVAGMTLWIHLYTDQQDFCNEQALNSYWYRRTVEEDLVDSKALNRIYDAEYGKCRHAYLLMRLKSIVDR